MYFVRRNSIKSSGVVEKKDFYRAEVEFFLSLSFEGKAPNEKSSENLANDLFSCYLLRGEDTWLPFTLQKFYSELKPTGLMNVQPFAKEKVCTRTHIRTSKFLPFGEFQNIILAFFYRVMINLVFILKTVAHFCNTFETRGSFQVDANNVRR